MTNVFDNSNYPKENPECIVLGRHVAWRIELEDYPDPTYSVQFVVQPVGDSTAEATIDGVSTVIDGETYWVFELDSATSGADPWTTVFTADVQCRWDLVVTRVSDTNKAILQSGFLRLYIASSDRRSHAEVMVAKINSILEGRADHDVNSYSIKSRSISRMGVDELVKWRDYYLNELRISGDTSNDGTGRRSKRNTVRVRFT